MARRIRAHSTSPPCWLLFALLGCLISIASATAPSAPTFVLTRGRSNLTFALNVDKNSDEICFRLVASADYSWVAIGAGSRMKNTLMFVVYQAKDSNKVTLSPRIATGNFEPSYAPSINTTLMPGSGITKNTFIANACCANCRKWNGGSLDINSEEQDFIYALGPTTSGIESDSKTARMQRHISYGHFEMDLVQAATGISGVPTNIVANNGTEQIGDPHADYEILLYVHALFMLGTIVVLLPAGVFFLRILQKPKLHSINQVFGVVIVLIGGGLGIYLSSSYNLTRTFQTSHQIIGLIIMGLLVIQSALGYLHHRSYVRTQRSSSYTLPHIWHGRLVILFGALNGFLGFRLAGRSALGYLLSLLVFIAIYTVVYLAFWNRNRRKRQAFSNPRARNFRDGGHASSDSTTDIPLTSHAAPPAYQADYVPQPLGAPPGNRF